MVRVVWGWSGVGMERCADGESGVEMVRVVWRCESGVEM